MKKCLFLLLGFVISSSLCVFAQEKTIATEGDAARMEITPYVDPDLGFNQEVTKQLTNKMNSMLTKSGMAGAPNQRFVLAANVNVLSEDIIVTTKEMFQYELEVMFVLGDGVEGTKFASNSLVVKGVADTKAGAYLAALKKIPVSHSSFQPFFEKGKMEVVNYFATKCDFILKEANVQADRKEFDEALASLLSIPTVCEDCYYKAQDLSIAIYKRKIENECQINISHAKAEIAANKWNEALSYLAGYTPDIECYAEVAGLITQIQDHRCAEALAHAQSAWAKRNAVEAAKWLGEIPTDSKCHPEAQILQKSIANSLDEEARREWEFKVKQQDDQMAYKNATIQAIRDVGVSLAQRKEPLVYRVGGWFR
jgi:hypothetical protein